VDRPSPPSCPCRPPVNAATLTWSQIYRPRGTALAADFSKEATADAEMLSGVKHRRADVGPLVHPAFKLCELFVIADDRALYRERT